MTLLSRFKSGRAVPFFVCQIEFGSKLMKHIYVGEHIEFCYVTQINDFKLILNDNYNISLMDTTYLDVLETYS